MIIPICRTILVIDKYYKEPKGSNYKFGVNRKGEPFYNKFNRDS